MSHDHDEDPRDLTWESLINAAGTARLMGEHSLYLILEFVIESREAGTLGDFARELEQARSGGGDHPAIEEHVARRLALASQEVCS